MIAQLVRLQLNGRSAESIEAQVVVTASVGGGSATGQLPAPTTVVNAYQDWRATYIALDSVSRVIKPLSVGEHKGLADNYASDPQACQQQANRFIKHFNSWLRASEFVPIRDALIRAFDKAGEDSSVQFVICTNNAQLQHLPWTLWDFLSLYPDVEVAISSQTYRAHPNNLPFPAEPGCVKVLAVLGDSSDIDVEQDRQFLSALPQANVTFLPTPERSALHDELWNRSFDILFFAGHSKSRGSTGTLRLNEREELSLEDIQYALGRIAKRGLTLAIFNSCDGLGLAKYLSQTIVPNTIPYIIVMREVVPDAVAQAFLKYFLEAFSKGETFHTAVRSARERLENSSEALPPYGDWMPVIWQNPLASPPVWPQLVQKHAPDWFLQLRRWPLVAVGVAAAVTGLRFLGGLQGIELWAYDRFMQLQPADPVDPNILLITIKEEEIDKDELGSIGDAKLEELLKIVFEAQPSVVGLDIIRDESIDSEYAELKRYFSDGDKLITICGVGDSTNNKEEIAPPPDANIEEGVGFSDISRDRDLTARRHLLGMDNDVSGKCRVDIAFSTMVAYNYIRNSNDQGIHENTDYWALWSQNALSLHRGAYHSEDMKGDNILLDYRVSSYKRAPFETVTLLQILNGEVSPTAMQGRVVLIGTDATSIPDRVRTPFRDRYGAHQEIPGVVFQAHLVSQLIDIATGDRLPLRTWHPIADCVWILLWAGMGGLVGMKLPRPIGILIGEGIAVIVLFGSCWLAFVWTGLWIPLIPAAVSLAGATVAYSAIPKSLDGIRR